mmetsp:Transcript_34490/g.87217  ORF Transcript_34490/g.87217 Transcript_34490/m.87217 type:complete len:108 (-) Transcript_34490:130-453(-)
MELDMRSLKEDLKQWLGPQESKSIGVEAPSADPPGRAGESSGSGSGYFVTIAVFALMAILVLIASSSVHELCDVWGAGDANIPLPTCMRTVTASTAMTISSASGWAP